MQSTEVRISQELRVLIGRPISDCWRALDLVIFDFGPTRWITNRDGDLLEHGEVALHVQCRWRFVDGSRILFGRDDLTRPAEGKGDGAFDPGADDTALDVARRRWFDERRESRPKVVGAVGDAYGGFRIDLEGGFAIEGFPCGSRSDAEHWRLRGHRADASHFVVTGSGVR